MDNCICCGGLLCFRDYCIDCWEVLCVLRDLLVEILGGLKNAVKCVGGSIGCEVWGKEVAFDLWLCFGVFVELGGALWFWCFEGLRCGGRRLF